MRGVIKVVSQEEFDVEMAKLKPAYFTAFPDKDPAVQNAVTPAAVADSSKVATTTVAAEKVKI